MRANMSSKLILEGIARQICVTAVYNKMAVVLAPHILYTKHGELYVDGVTLERDGRPPRELKLGAFKLTGLNDLALSDRAFEPQALFNPAEPRYEGTTLFAVNVAA